eukprot:2010307-Pyramimonas_sp.AAC.2
MVTSQRPEQVRVTNPPPSFRRAGFAGLARKPSGGPPTQPKRARAEEGWLAGLGGQVRRQRAGWGSGHGRWN